MIMRIRINSKLKIKSLRQRRIPACRQAGLSADRQAPSEEKVKTLIIDSHCEPPETSGDEAIHCFISSLRVPRRREMKQSQR